MQASDGTGRFLVGIYPAADRADGMNSMSFTRELYALEFPDGVRGPAGENPVFAEVLWLVTEEGYWLVALSLLVVSVLVLSERRSLVGTWWVLLPLVTGLLLTIGLMPVWSLKLNFFNVIVFPALLGMGVDHGVHFYRRWEELGQDAEATHGELAGSLTICTVTTMAGYSSMIMARHPGLQSIGIVACLGLTCIWLTSLGLLPGLLRWHRPKPSARHRAPAGGKSQ